jgi:hypothetical protein
MSKAFPRVACLLVAAVLMAPAHAGLLSEPEIFDLLRPAMAPEGELSLPTAGPFEVRMPDSAAALLGGFISLADLFLPAREARNSAGLELEAQPPACNDCSDAPPAESLNATVRPTFGRALMLVVMALGLLAIVVLVRVVRHIQGMTVEEAYIKDRWGRKTNIN